MARFTWICVESRIPARLSCPVEKVFDFRAALSLAVCAAPDDTTGWGKRIPHFGVARFTENYYMSDRLSATLCTAMIDARAWALSTQML